MPKTVTPDNLSDLYADDPTPGNSHGAVEMLDTTPTPPAATVQQTEDEVVEEKYLLDHEKDEMRYQRRRAESNRAYEKTRALLNRPLDRDLVKQREGYGIDKRTGKTKVLNYLEHHTVTKLLNSIFGPGHWSIGETKIQDFFDPSATDGIPRAVRVTKTLSFSGVEGFDYSPIEMTGYQVVHQPTKWENGKKVLLPYTWGAYEMALGNAEAKAFKRAAAQLGEALGLALYDDDAEVNEVSDEETSGTSGATTTSRPAAPKARPAQQQGGFQEPEVVFGMDPTYCDTCGDVIQGYTNRKTGKTYTTDDLVAISKKQTGGKVLCLNCRR